MKAKDLYNNIANDLSELGIYVDKKDIFVLVHIVLTNIKKCCKQTKRIYLAKDKKINARLMGEDIKIYINDDITIKNKRLRMTDKIANSIFERMLLPSIEALMESELEDED